MWKRILTISIIIVGVFVYKVGIQLVKKWVRAQGSAPSSVLEQRWVTQTLGDGGVIIELPVIPKDTPHKYPSSVANMIRTSQALVGQSKDYLINIAFISYLPGNPLNLDIAADATLNSVRSALGKLSYESKKTEGAVLGERAIDMYARFSSKTDEIRQMHGIIWISGTNCFVVQLFSSVDNAIATDVWRKMCSSIRDSSRHPPS